MVVVGVCMRATAITTALLMAALLVVSPPASALSVATPLVSWEAAENGLQDPVELRLGADQVFETYYFQLKPQDEVQAAVGFIEVTNSFGDLACRGIVSHQFGLLSVNRQCPDLQEGRTYIVNWITDRSGTELVLSGYGAL